MSAAMPVPAERLKLTIVSLDDNSIQVVAQYNPNQIQLDRQIPWGQHNARDNRMWWKRGRKDNKPEHDLEYTGADGRSMSLELLFDRYESLTSIEAVLEKLEELAQVTDPNSKEHEWERRPHLCLVSWGPGATGGERKDHPPDGKKLPDGSPTPGPRGMRPFRCVIESLSIKITMFDGDGTPLRASCTLKLKESYALSVNLNKPASPAATPR